MRILLDQTSRFLQKKEKKKIRIICIGKTHNRPFRGGQDFFVLSTHLSSAKVNFGIKSIGKENTNYSRCIHNKNSVFTLQRPELHLDVPTLQRPIAEPGCTYTTRVDLDLHLGVSGQQERLLLLDVFTIQRRELHLDLSGLS
jgi:hypothetical protein